MQNLTIYQFINQIDQFAVFICPERLINDLSSLLNLFFLSQLWALRSVLERIPKQCP